MRIHKHPVRRDGHRRGLVQPHMPVNPRALVKPALELARVHLHRHEILPAEPHDVRDVLAETVVAALVPRHQPAVHPHRRVAEHAVERQPDTLAGIFLRQLERPAIPADAVLVKTRPHRLEPVARVRRWVERQFNRPVMRQIQRAPRRVVELLGRRAAARAGLVQPQRIRPVVAQMKLPARIQRKMFARRGGGGRGGRGRVSGAEVQRQHGGRQRGQPEGGGELHEDNLGKRRVHGKPIS